MKYIEFKIVQELPKTKVYAVIEKKHRERIGTIRWFGPWRQYCFYPSRETIWNTWCLNDISTFLNTLMVVRKKGKNKLTSKDINPCEANVF